MMAMVLSVHPKWADMILEGRKTVEFRTVNLESYAYRHEFGHAPSWYESSWPERYSLAIYSTAPVGMVIGEVSLRDSCDFPMNPDGHWPKILLEWGCITEEELNVYAKGRKIYANTLNHPVRYDEPRPLSAYGLKRSPQSFAYVKEA